VTLLAGGFSFYLFVKASQSLHNRMLRSVLRAKIEFFDMNPLGRILNRFSADVGISDKTLPLTIYVFLVRFFVALGGVATAIAVLPFILLAIPPLIWASAIAITTIPIVRPKR
jgi:ATP-binding cassette subfamily C (CFTR/MRP) protein 4